MAELSIALALVNANASPTSPATTILVPETPLSSRKRLDSNVGSEQIGDVQRLQRSRSQLTESLQASTARNARLQLRARIEAAEAAVLRQRVAGTEALRAEAARRITREEGKTRRRGRAIALMALTAVAYAWWCVYNAPEMRYIRERRLEALGL